MSLTRYEPEIQVQIPLSEVVLDFNPYQNRIVRIGGTTRRVNLDYSGISDDSGFATEGVVCRVSQTKYVDIHTPFDPVKSGFIYTGNLSGLKKLGRANPDLFIEDPVIQHMGHIFLDRPGAISWLALDIENESGIGVEQEKAKLLLVSYGDNKEVLTWEADEYLQEDGCPLFDDTDLIKNVLADLSERQLAGKLDLLCGFWFGYDIKRMIEAATRAGLDTQYGLRIGDAWVNVRRAWVQGRQVWRFTTKNIAILDLYEQGVMRDQKIPGIGRSLKAVSTHYGYPHESFLYIGDTIHHFHNEEFRDYARKDIEATKFLLQVYLPVTLASAKRYGIPLSFACNASRGFGGMAACAMAFQNTHIIGTKTNDQIYGELSFEAAISGMRQHCSKCHGDLGLIVKKALVFEPKQCKCGNRIYVTRNKRISGTSPWGIERDLISVDFTSMYSSAIRMACCPGATQIIHTEPYHVGDRIQITRSGEYLEMIVPDRNTRVTYQIRCFLGASPFKDYIERAFKERNMLKTRMKQCKDGSPQYLAYDAAQNSIKVVLNSLFGWTSTSQCYNADISTAIAIIGLTRFVSEHIIDHLGDRLLHMDTDGFIPKGGISDLPLLNKWVKDLVEKEIGIENHLVLEGEEVTKALFLYPKTYVLEKNNKLVYKGVAFNAPCKMLKQLTRDSIKLLLDGETSDVAWKFIESAIGEAPREKFVITYRPSGNKEKYDSGFIYWLGKLLEQKGIRMTSGMNIEAIKTRAGCELWPTRTPPDRDYYIERAGRVLSNLQYKRPTGQLDLF